MIIAIDGPSGTGKSSTAQRLAAALGFIYFDTGAMYRAITLIALESKTNLDDPAQVQALIAAFSFSIEQEGLERRYLLNDRDITDDIRAPAVTGHVSAVSALPAIREAMVPIQRLQADRFSAVFEGRDVGTVVFPDADFKFFLTARPEVRAQRRHAERPHTSVEEILTDQKRRDTHDSTRAHSPLKAADDATIVDTSDLTLDQVVDQLLKEVRRK